MDVAESAGQVVLTVTADPTPLEAGMRRARQTAETTGQALTRALSGGQAGQSLTGLTIKLNSLQQELQNVTIGTKRFNELRREIDATQKTLNKANGGGGGGILGQLATGLAGLGVGAAVGGFLKGSIDAAVELETITRKLSNTLGPQGAGGAIAFTKGLSDQLGLSFKTLAGSFGSFTAAATAANVPIKDQEALFAAISKAGQAFGLSNNELSGSFLALQQVASKGAVQMEELRGQLGERLPIALAATAKGLGITQGELFKLVESGKLTSGTFFTALTKGLNDITSGAGGVKTAAQDFQALGNAWDELQTSLGQSALPTVKAGVQALSNAIKTVNANLKSFVMLAGGLAAASAAFYLLAKAASIAATAQKALAVAAAVAQTVLNPANALKVAAALAVGVGTAYALGKAMEGVSAENEKAADAANTVKQNTNAANAAAAAALELSKKRSAEEQKTLDVTLKRQQLNLELAGIQEQIDSAKQLATLEGTALVKLQNKIALNEKLRQQQAIQLELQRELAKPAGDGKNGTRSSAAIDELLAKQERVNAEVRKAYKDAGVALEVNGKRAAEALAGAQTNLQSVLRGGFEFLTPQLQQEQLARARASIQPLVNQGVIRQGLDISTPDKLFQLAGFAESYSSSANELAKATKENALAVKALADKKWDVNVTVAADGSARAYGDVVAGALS